MMLFSCLGLAGLAAWVYLALGHGSFWRPALPLPDAMPIRLPSIDIVVPARNEATILPHSLPSLLKQDYAGEWRVILVDDNSNDETATVARQIAVACGQDNNLSIVTAPALPSGWRGKVAAMHTGVQHGSAEYILFTDADIHHAPESLRTLVARAEAGKLDLVSRMVRLHCASFAEKLLIPAFVFFFAMLYPFRRSNNPRSPVAAAAGGTMLARRTIIDKIGGMACIRSALIDDCGLARAIKDAGGKTELLLTRDIDSLRLYPHLYDVWDMVARSAYTQLRYSPWLLAGTIIGMAVMYAAPILLFILPVTATGLLSGLLSLILMAALYAPMVRFYDLPWPWALTLPVAALIYGAATLDSARLYYQGKGGQWKGRAQAQAGL